MYKLIFLINNKNGDKMIKDIMSKKIIFSNLNSSIKEVAKKMLDNNIGFIPIKEKDNYIGVITDRDICLSIPTISSVNDSIKSYITNDVIYIDVNSSIDEALRVMSEKKIKRLLVKEKDNTIGVLSLSDILNYSNNQNIINTCKSIFYIRDNEKSLIAEIDEFYL